jgi:hypothetical protein
MGEKMSDLIIQDNSLSQNETAASAVAAQSKAMVESRYVIAKKFPRDIDVVREKLIKDSKRPSFAASARYVKPIGKDQRKWLSGPSIRFAEAAIRHMGNITVEVMTVYDDKQKRIVRVTVTDLEANVPYFQDVTITKTIERKQAKEGDLIVGTRKNSYGDNLFILEATDDDVINKQQLLISKAIRTIGLRLIPGDLIDECMAIVVATQSADDSVDPDMAKRKIFDAFASVGVSLVQLKEFLGHDATVLNQKELVELRSLYAAIKDGEATWRDLFDEKVGERKDKSEPKKEESKSPKTLTFGEFEAKKQEWKNQIEFGLAPQELIEKEEKAGKVFTDAQKKELFSFRVETNDGLFGGEVKNETI